MCEGMVNDMIVNDESFWIEFDEGNFLFFLCFVFDD